MELKFDDWIITLEDKPGYKFMATNKDSRFNKNLVGSGLYMSMYQTAKVLNEVLKNGFSCMEKDELTLSICDDFLEESQLSFYEKKYTIKYNGRKNSYQMLRYGKDWGDFGEDELVIPFYNYIYYLRELILQKYTEEEITKYIIK